MYKCKMCGSEFSDPHVDTSTENLDGENGIERSRAISCPQCGSGRIEDVSDKPEIVLRFRDFMARYSLADIKALDDDIDGISLINYWRMH